MVETNCGPINIGGNATKGSTRTVLLKMGWGRDSNMISMRGVPTLRMPNLVLWLVGSPDAGCNLVVGAENCCRQPCLTAKAVRKG
jgi:hypothetical protein